MLHAGCMQEHIQALLQAQERLAQHLASMSRLPVLGHDTGTDDVIGAT